MKIIEEITKLYCPLIQKNGYVKKKILENPYYRDFCQNVLWNTPKEVSEDV